VDKDASWGRVRVRARAKVRVRESALNRKSRSRETALSKTDAMIISFFCPIRFFSSLVFATVAHSAPSLGKLGSGLGLDLWSISPCI
jgi:hypothetical protein